MEPNPLQRDWGNMGQSLESYCTNMVKNICFCAESKRRSWREWRRLLRPSPAMANEWWQLPTLFPAVERVKT